MHKHSPIQILLIVVLIAMVLTFYMLMAAETIQETDSLNYAEPLFLIIIAIILLAMYSEVSKIESYMRPKRTKRK